MSCSSLADRQQKKTTLLSGCPATKFLCSFYLVIGHHYRPHIWRHLMDTRVIICQLRCSCCSRLRVKFSELVLVTTYSPVATYWTWLKLHDRREWVSRHTGTSRCSRLSCFNVSLLSAVSSASLLSSSDDDKGDADDSAAARMITNRKSRSLLIALLDSAAIAAFVGVERSASCWRIRGQYVDAAADWCSYSRIAGATARVQTASTSWIWHLSMAVTMVRFITQNCSKTCKNVQEIETRYIMKLDSLQRLTVARMSPL